MEKEHESISMVCSSRYVKWHLHRAPQAAIMEPRVHTAWHLQGTEQVTLDITFFFVKESVCKNSYGRKKKCACLPEEFLREGLYA